MRKRIMRNTGCPLASSNYKSILAQREILRAGHEERIKTISLMTKNALSIEDIKPTKHYGKPYVLMMGNKLYLTESEVSIAISAGYNVLYG